MPPKVVDMFPKLLEHAQGFVKIWFPVSLGGNRILKYICKRNFQYISCFWFFWVKMNCWTESKWACQGYLGFEKSCQNSHCFDMMMALLSKLLHWTSGQSQQHQLGLYNRVISRHNFVLYNKSQNFCDEHQLIQSQVFLENQSVDNYVFLQTLKIFLWNILSCGTTEKALGFREQINFRGDKVQK
jgi:hypothetical protein